jgi:acetylornithine deacetylase/succinyl-diaminopimelate desuccinylase-like protein
LGNFIHGGVQYGVVPGLCTAGNDIRLIMGMNPKKVEADVRTFLEKLKERDPDLRIEMQVKASYDPVEISPKEPIVESAIRAAERVIGFKPTFRGLTGTDDASFLIAKAGIPTICAFGPGLLNVAHKPNETARIRDIIDATKIYSLLALDYLGTLQD